MMNKKIRVVNIVLIMGILISSCFLGYLNIANNNVPTNELKVEYENLISNGELKIAFFNYSDMHNQGHADAEIFLLIIDEIKLRNEKSFVNMIETIDLSVFKDGELDNIYHEIRELYVNYNKVSYIKELDELAISKGIYDKDVKFLSQLNDIILADTKISTKTSKLYYLGRAELKDESYANVIQAIYEITNSVRGYVCEKEISYVYDLIKNVPYEHISPNEFLYILDYFIHEKEYKVAFQFLDFYKDELSLDGYREKYETILALEKSIDDSFMTTTQEYFTLSTVTKIRKEVYLYIDGELISNKSGYNSILLPIENRNFLNKLIDVKIVYSYVNPIKYNGKINRINEIINLENMIFYSGDLKNINKIDNYKDAKHILASGAFQKNSVSGSIDYMKDMTSLESIRFIYNDGIYGDIATLSRFTNLKYIDISNAKIIGDLSEISNLSELRSISLFGADITGSSTDLKKNLNLHTIKLLASNIVLEVDDIETFKYAEELSSSRSEGDISGLSHMKYLSHLELSGNMIGDISVLANFPALNFLRLTSSRIHGSLDDLPEMKYYSNLNNKINCNNVDGKLEIIDYYAIY